MLLDESGLFPQVLWRSNGQTMPTLGTTGANHGTTATSGHTDEKAMGTLAANYRRLIGAFHVKTLEDVTN